MVEQLVERIRQKDQRAMSQLYQMYIEELSSSKAFNEKKSYTPITRDGITHINPRGRWWSRGFSLLYKFHFMAILLGSLESVSYLCREINYHTYKISGC